MLIYLTLYLDGEVIEPVPAFRYLGLNLDFCLSWSDHIAVLCSKLFSVVGIIAKHTLLSTE